MELQFQLIQDTSRQLLGKILPDTVNTVKCCSWWWAKTSPETWNCSSNSSKTPAGSYLGKYYQILWIQSSAAPDNGRKHRPKHGTAVPTHPRHQPAATWVNTTRYCEYSQVLLLMMGENIARNMELQFQLIQDTSRQLLGRILPDTVNTVKCSWWWVKTSPETCRADNE